MENHSFTHAVTFGRFNLPHPGHVDLIQRMLTIADHAYVCVSGGKNNNPAEYRIDVLEQLCCSADLPMERITFYVENNPYDAVSFVTDDPVSGFTELEIVTGTVVVLGVDQTVLGERLRDDLGIAFVPNEVRVGSSTVIRYFLEIGDEEIVRDIYYNNDYLFDQVVALRNEELAREKS